MVYKLARQCALIFILIASATVVALLVTPNLAGAAENNLPECKVGYKPERIESGGNPQDAIEGRQDDVTVEYEYRNTDGERCSPTPAQRASGDPDKGYTPINCAGTKYWFNLPTCLMRAGFSWIGAGLIWFGVQIATIAGGIFEGAITYTIVKFGEYLQILRPAIDAGWMGLRDVANIVIIGLFVFVAINIILGVKDFGERRAVAKILIVAVLINFSLLFTKIIVDASNFTAYQFYNSMVKGVDGRINQTVGGGGVGDFQFSVTSSGISASFMKFLGVEGIFDTQEKLKKITDNNDNALYALGYGLLGFIFLLAVAAVFLYGAFLIISRAVLIIFLMLTSALAFASWIIPNQFISDGWEKWWKSLLKSAFFAPILMAFLWMTLRVSQELSKALTSGPGAKGTLGALAENASSQANLVALLNFALILGLLYASFATASAFSSTISGFRFAKAGVGGTIFGSLAGASRLGGMFGRNTVGWAGQSALSRYRRYVGRPDDVDDTGRIRSYEGRRTGLTGFLNRGILRSANYLATSRFDALQKGPVRSAFGAMGGTLTKSFMEKTGGLTKDDFRSAMEKKAQKADTLARAIGPDADQMAAVQRNAERQINAAQQQVTDARATATTNARGAQVERPRAELKVAAHEEGLQRTENEKAAARSRHESEMRLEQDRIARAQRDAESRGATPVELERLRAPLRDIQAAHERELATIDERTRGHREDLQTARETVEGLNREAAQAAGIAPQVQAAERALRALGTAADRAAREQVRLREQLLWDPRARPFVAGEMRGQAGRAALKALAAEVRTTGSPPVAPVVPPAAPPRAP